MGSRAAPGEPVAPPDRLLDESAPVARAYALEHCPHAPGGDCTWYHGAWQYLRALGVLKAAGGQASFFSTALRALAAGGAARRVLICGAADDAMALIAIEAFRDAAAPLELTVVDRCEAPLALNRWSAARAGTNVTTHRARSLELAVQVPFDVVAMNSFLPFIEPAARPLLFARCASLLRPGGRLLLTNRLRPDTSGRPFGFTPEQARGFCEAVRREAAQRALPGCEPATLEAFAREYTARFRAFALRTRGELIGLLQGAGFVPDQLDTAEFTAAGRSDAIAGPSAAERADYVRLVATFPGQ